VVMGDGKRRRNDSSRSSASFGKRQEYAGGIGDGTRGSLLLLALSLRPNSDSGSRHKSSSRG
jgi:hypothetical protein